MSYATKILLKLIYLIVAFTTISCTDDEIANKIKSDVDLYLNNVVEIDGVCDVKRMSDVGYTVGIKLSDPIIHSEERAIIVSNLIFHSDLLSSCDSVIFNILSTEDSSNVLNISYGKNSIRRNNNAYQKNQVLDSLVIFCLKSFTELDPFYLDRGLEITFKEFPNQTYNASFFKLLSAFAQECESAEGVKAKLTFVSLYHISKHSTAAEGSIDLSRLKPILEKLWRICDSRNHSLYQVSNEIFKLKK